MVFTDVLAGWPGSVHDSRVLHNSVLWQTAANKFPGDTHLLGDGGYPLLRYNVHVKIMGSYSQTPSINPQVGGQHNKSSLSRELKT